MTAAVRTDVGPFTMVPAWLIDSGVSHGALRLYAVLGLYADRESGECWPSRSTLADRLGASTNSVDRWLKELRQVEALEWEQRHGDDGELRSNLYTVKMAQPTGAGTPTDGAPPTPAGLVSPAPPMGQRTRTSELQPEELDGVQTVFAAWIESTGRDPGRTRLDGKRRDLIRKALEDYPVGDLVAAVQGWQQSPWHSGDNDSGKIYNDLGLLLRNAEKIEFFRDCAAGMPVMELVASAADQAWDDVLAVVARFGRTHKPEWKDPKIRPALQAIGGYWEVCNAVNVAPLRAGFLAAYREQP